MSPIEIYIVLCIILVTGVWLWARKIKREIHEAESIIREALNKIVFMRVENHNDLLFAYNAFNEEFICQGTDLEDLNIQFGKRFPDRRGVIVEPEETTSVL